ncbi:hypothetical protein AB0O34_25260, partial [Sphaerisporangium sp. NPDC088356]|uniref:hypothetical protein n=1 Tax=Sphaerisporangium sp. NPDC088356 TaxID=3154871 RepID=UPI0034225399
MGRLIRTELVEAVIGLILTSLLAQLGDIAAMLGITGTGVVMAITALLMEAGNLLLAILAFVFPFVSTTSLETVAEKPITAVVNGPSAGDHSTTIQNVLDQKPPKPQPGPRTAKIDKNAGVEVSPESLHLSCFGEQCRQRITIRSTGTATLKLTSTKREGAGREAWRFSRGCDREAIPPGDECTFWVWAVRSDAVSDYTAELVIHQNTSGPASIVSLTVEEDTAPDPTPSD